MDVPSEVLTVGIGVLSAAGALQLLQQVTTLVRTIRSQAPPPAQEAQQLAQSLIGVIQHGQMEQVADRFTRQLEAHTIAEQQQMQRLVDFQADETVMLTKFSAQLDALLRSMERLTLAAEERERLIAQLRQRAEAAGRGQHVPHVGMGGGDG